MCRGAFHNAFPPKTVNAKLARMRRTVRPPRTVASASVAGRHGLKFEFENYDCVFSMKLRLAWIFGLLPTRDYALRIRQQRLSPAVTEPTDWALERLERPLLEDRLAVILFLLGITIFAYTFLNAPV